MVGSALEGAPSSAAEEGPQRSSRAPVPYRQEERATRPNMTRDGATTDAAVRGHSHHHVRDSQTSAIVASDERRRGDPAASGDCARVDEISEGADNASVETPTSAEIGRADEDADQVSIGFSITRLDNRVIG
jgi:hypothetical protein